MELQKIIEQLGLLPNDKVFLRQYRKDGEEEMILCDIDDHTLKKNVKHVQHHYGGKQNDYNCYRFILE